MNETEFWQKLEYRISGELAQMNDNRLKYLWCDGTPHTIDWAALLPAQDVARWLAVDLVGKCIQIEPGAAVPDFS